MNKVTEFIKREVVLVAACILAIVSMFVVKPDKLYVEYIDFKTLAVLLCLMLVMAGLQKLGLFEKLGSLLLKKVSTTRQAAMVLIFLCFFSSMLITNDVALITFVPFAIIVFKMANMDWEVIPVVVFQTIAANLGSMLTPIGNPQNLYLFNRSGMSVGEFVMLMLPLTVVSGILLVIALFFIKNKTIASFVNASYGANSNKQYMQIGIYVVLFILCISSVVGFISWQIMLILCLAIVLITDRIVIKRIDYSLLITFIGFFVFIGNMQRIQAFASFLQSVINGNEQITAVVSSQIISNVPAALLLSGFTDCYDKLIIGTNLGGLGTLIASMASLISYKYIVREYSNKKLKYFIYFTVANIIFLIILLSVTIFF